MSKNTRTSSSPLESVSKNAYNMSEPAPKNDVGKNRIACIPPESLRAIGWIRTYGLKKYGSLENYKEVAVDRWRDALMRHTVEYLDNPSKVDDESGYPHLWHMACNVAILCELEKERYVQNGYGSNNPSNKAA